MARYGLVRPVTGRHFAGVCAAVGRATNTDPVLWRVLFAVLTLFGGVGLLAYLIGWLLIPADGDTASPIEAVLGRGRSRTSAPVAVIGAVVAVLVFALVASEGLRPAVVGALVVLGAALLLSRGTLQRPNQQATQPEPQPAPPFPPEPVMPPSYQSAADLGTPFTSESVTVPAPAEPRETVSLGKDPDGDSGPATTHAVREDDVPVGQANAVPSATETPTAPQPAAPRSPQAPYGQPFAPHGPFASPPGPYPPTFGPVGPQTPTKRLPLYGPYPPIPGAGLPLPVSGDPMLQYPGMPYSGPPAPKPKVKRPRSRLGRATLSAMAIALGTLGIVNLAGVSIAGSAYFAVALAVVGLGLVAGAWVGRARLLIPLGIALSFGMLAATAATYTEGDYRNGRPELWMPLSVEELTANSPRVYEAGAVRIDLSALDFTGQVVTFEASKEIGEMIVILPRNVDVTIKAKVEIGDAQVLHSSWGGLSDSWRTVMDDGDDGPNLGGTLNLTLSVDVGNLEVHR